MKRAPKLRSVRPHFSLLNAVNTFNGFSCGYSDVPPQQFWPANHQLVFTFSLSVDDYDTYEDEPDVHLNMSNNISVWGIQDIKFLSIGMTSVKATELGLTAMFHFDLQYLYNIVGAITKNIAVFNQFDMFKSEIVYPKTHDVYAGQYLKRSVRNLFETVPYKYWIFSDMLWRLAPNVFNHNMVNADSAEYFFRYCTRSFKNVAQNDGSRITIFGLNCQATSGITALLRSSVLSFLQNVKSDEFTFDEESDYLAPLVLMAMINDRTNVVTGERSDVQSLVAAFNEKSVVWDSVLSQPAKVAERMIANDRALADALLGLVDFE